ncbi:hypothetical protein GCM10023403_27930 [Pseudonocardia benzenivorans]|uniref:Uncharacterized protein n=2 Tax=Pseudonocardia TaxID=1847 RepID=F4CV51_PSEUX|nr:hypothetical protein Psed_6508 [Pseudonocardia dioxanivorans CB1190]GJF03582.1 hypothetical protein PSD17_25420 [Pseudonocardia sp. D17]
MSIGRSGSPPPVRADRPGCGIIPRDMTAWLSVLVPLLVMFFALGMERVESRLRDATMPQDELDEMLERPRPEEVRAMFRQGTARALELFRLRNRRPGKRKPASESKIAS